MATVAHLTEDQRNQIGDKCGVLEALFVDLRSQMESKPKHEDLSCTLKDLDTKQMLLESEVNAILSSPPPAPKKEEEKKEEPAAEGQATEGDKPAADAEMQDEQQNNEQAQAQEGEAAAGQ